MKVLILCEHFEPSVDACSKRMSTIASELVERGHDVVVLASDTSLADAAEGYSPRAYVRYYKTYRMGKKTVMRRLANNLSELNSSKRAAKTLGSFDAVVVTTPPLLLALSAIAISKRVRAKLVLDVRDVWPDVAYEMGSFRPGSLYGQVFERIARKAYGYASLITTVTPGKVAKLRDKLSEPQRGKVHLVPNGLDLAFLEQEEDRKAVERYMGGDAPTCVYVGNLGLAQGLSSLVRIAADYPEVRFLLFGGGAEEELLKKEIEKRSLANVGLCGRVDSRTAYTVLKHANCAYVSLVNSNLRDSIPTKLYEALGCGCPVLLAARGDSVKLLAETGLGYAVAPEDVDGLCCAFGDLITAKWEESQREAAAAQIVAHHSRQAAAWKMERLLTCEIREESGE